MNIATYIDALVSYATKRGLTQPEDYDVARNKLLDLLQLDSCPPSEAPQPEALEEILKGLLDYACGQGLCQDHAAARDLFDSRLMGALTPFPREILAGFRARYAEDPASATSWYYQVCQDTNYIRRDRVAKQLHWTSRSPYGTLDLTFHPEEHCSRVGRQNDRPLPLRLQGEDWFLRYASDPYYKEHCTVFPARPTPMALDTASFSKLLEFVEQFPHYFLACNAELSLSDTPASEQEHFLGGQCEFALFRAPVEQTLSFPAFPQVEVGAVHWPLPVLRLQSAEPEPLIELADHILNTWQGNSDNGSSRPAEAGGTPRNTAAATARQQDGRFVLDLILLHHLTAEPLPLEASHSDHPHMLGEAPGLTEVMGLAVLPAPLKAELASLEEAILKRKDIRSDPVLAKHADWIDRLKGQYVFTAATTREILLRETGKVFSHILEDASAFPHTAEGQATFRRFLTTVGGTW